MKRKRLLWLGSILAVGLLGLVTLSDWREEMASRGPGVGAELSLNHSGSQPSPPPGRIDPFRPFRSVSRRAGNRTAGSGSAVTVKREKPRRKSGIPLAKILNPGDSDELQSVTPAAAARPQGVAHVGEPVTRANWSSPRPERRSSQGVPAADPGLVELEQGYQAAQARLFGGGGSFGAGNGNEGSGDANGSDNPFDDALDDSGSDDAADAGDSGNGDPGEGDAGDGGDSDGSSGDSGD